MDWENIGLGGVLIAIGIACTVLRFTKPSLLAKLEPMKKTWGATAGSIMHFIAYSVLPIVAGILLI